MEIEAGAAGNGSGVTVPITDVVGLSVQQMGVRRGSLPRPGCPIKGNIGVDGEKIYRMPWPKYYSRTRIDETEGGQWFCDQGEAVAVRRRPARYR